MVNEFAIMTARKIAMIATLSIAVIVGGADSGAFIRVNQVGYLPSAPKVAVVCVLQTSAADRFTSFVVRDERSRVVVGPSPSRATGPFGPCAETWRLDF